MQIKDLYLYINDFYRKFLAFIVVCLVLPAIGLCQPSSYPPDIPNAVIKTYKTIGEIQLKVWIFNPVDHKKSDRRPAVIFFFGGGWRGGNPIQFAKHCEYLAARGMVAMTADYRVSSRHGVKGNACIADAKSAVRWIRKNANDLGIDPGRIIASGGSAGGHLAAATATLPGNENPNDDTTISARPNVLILFNPAVIMTPIPGIWEPKVADRFEGNLSEISPYDHITREVGPTIIFHGTADETVPFKTVELFTKRMHEQGNRCELIGYKGEKHAFFNFGREDNAAFIDTVNKMDTFLVSLGYLKKPPETLHQK
jgi:acetyl esterase